MHSCANNRLMVSLSWPFLGVQDGTRSGSRREERRVQPAV